MTDYEFHGSNLVAGGRSAEGPSTYTGKRADRGDDLPGTFHEATLEEIDRAVETAHEAFDRNQALEAEARARLLERMADEIDDIADALVERMTAETGLGEGRVNGERGRTTAQLRMFAKVVREGSWVDARIDTAKPDRKPSPKPDLRRMLVPIGPVAVFGASNFPLAFSVAGGDTASAIAAGCPVIVKAHPGHPGTSELVAEALHRAVRASDFHPATFSMVHAVDPELSLALVRHPLLEAVGFTGSLQAGRAIFDTAAKRPRPIPVYAEMGSVNPLFILPGALSDRGDAIAEGLVGSVTLGAGQFCTNPGLVFARGGDDLDAFVGHVAGRLRDGAPFTMLHDGICRSYVEGVDRLTASAGVRLEARVDGGERTAGAAVLRAEAEAFLSDELLQEEVFGPSTLVVACSDLADMERVAATLKGNLTATLHGTGEDLRKAGRLVTLLRRRVGRLIFNGFPTGVEVCDAMHHGGPYPATTDVRSTSVGTAAIYRFARPICYQDFPEDALPPELRDGNARGIWRMVDGERTRGDV